MNRPQLDEVWANQAAPEDIGDADSFVPTNPEYPEQVENQYTAGWFVSPDDDLVKQPHQWVNSWQQSVDWQLQNWYGAGFGWAQEVTYKPGAVAYEGSTRYIAKVENTGLQPTLNPDTWEPAAFHTETEADQGYTRVKTKQDTHEARRDNPHEVDTEDVDGYTKAQIDQKVEEELADANNHINDKGDPHEVTPAQLEVLPETGGAFTGQIAMLRMKFGAGGGIRRVGSDFEIYDQESSGARLGLDNSSRVAKLNGEELLTETNYGKMRQRNAYKFSVPSADIHLPLYANINGYNSSFGGVSYESTAPVTYTDRDGVEQTAPVGVPGFGSQGLEIRPGAGQVLSSPVSPTGIQGTVFGILDGVPVVGQGALNQSNLLEYFPPGTSLSDLRVWLYPLTPQQISALGATQ